MLAIGVGATASVVSVIYGVLLRPFPYTESQRIVRVYEQHQGVEGAGAGRYLSNIAYYALRDADNTTLRDLVAYRVGEYTFTKDSVSSRLPGVQASSRLFSILGVPPIIGRPFSTGDEEAVAAGELILSYALWREQFGGDSSVLGRSALIDGRPHTIVGVAPAHFYFPDHQTRFWARTVVPRPVGSNPTVAVFMAIGRLKSGITPRQAEAELTGILRRHTDTPLGLTVAFGGNARPTVRAVSLADGMAADLKPALAFIAGAVAFLLLIVYANLANLILAQGLARQRELTIRAALGASRRDLLRHQLTEALVVAVPGAGLGLMLSVWLVNIVRLQAPSDFPRLSEIRVDAHVLTAGLVAAAVVSLAAAVIPALKMSAYTRVAHLGGGRNLSVSRAQRGERFRAALVVLEAACATVVIVTAALLGRSFVELITVDPGYTPDRVLTARVFIPRGDEQEARVWRVTEELLRRVRALPDVVAAGAGNMIPLSSGTFAAGFPVPGDYRRELPAGVSPRVAVSLRYEVTPGYAEALGLRLIGGRFFTESDVPSDREMWVVNEEFARRYLPRNPVGMVFPWTVEDRDAELEIVGIVRNTLKDGLDREPQPEFYDLMQSGIWSDLKLVIRTRGEPSVAASAVLALARDVAPDAAVEVSPLLERLAQSVARPRFMTLTAGVLAGLSSTLACAGLAVVLVHSLYQRRRDLCVRAALGASRSHLLQMVLRESCLRTTAGIAIGLAAATLVTRSMKGILFGVGTLDAAAFAAPVLLLLPVSAMVALLPALRAMNADPAEALKSE
jgi:predicted permease